MTSFSIMITTRNRVNELKRTLEQISRLNPAPAEIMVTADGCTDGTVEFLERWKVEGGRDVRECEREGERLMVEGGRKFVNVNVKVNERGRGTERRVIVNEKARGSVASRDRMMREAKGDLVLALDDDSYPVQVDALAHLSLYFEKNPKLAVMGLPQRTDEYPATLKQTDFGPERLVHSFASSGACLRVAAYRSLPGFEPMFFHMYEEPDYALQCVANGWEVRFFPQVIIRHHWTGSGRSEIRNHHRHARNELWSTMMRCPMPQALMMAAYRVFAQAGYAIKRGPSWIVREPLWWWQALVGLPKAVGKRKAVKWEGYKRWLSC